MRMTGSAIAVAALLAQPAVAQARAQERMFDVPAQDATTGLTELARQAGVQVLIDDENLKGRQTNAVKGRYSVHGAFNRLLKDTGLVWVKTGENAYAVVYEPSHAEVGTSNSPEILVQGRRDWSLNTGIERTQNDSQPFVVFDREAIRRSGAQTVEGFLRDQLSVNASPGASEQNGGGTPARSSINLRGLGAGETLILVDGRRLPSVNQSDGSAAQPSISGIALASIERIEVLASSASGIYGAGATGGAINIVLRRDYRGVEASAMVGGTYDGGGLERRLDLNGSFALENGRSNISISGSARRIDPVLARDRRSLLEDASRDALRRDPDYFKVGAPLGRSPNIKSVSGDPLVLKPEYGGAALPASYTFAPQGYRGLALDGVGPLVANAGRYDLGLAPVADVGGAYSRLNVGSEQQSLSITARRDMTSWLKAYAEVSGNRTTAFDIGSRVSGNVLVVAADAPNNPFTDAIEVNLPYPGTDVPVKAVNSQYRLLLGGIARLPKNWQAVLDLTLGRNSNYFSGALSDGGRSAPVLSAAFQQALASGDVDVLRGFPQPGVAYGYLASRYDAADASRAVTHQRNLSLRLAGPAPVRLPGGEISVTLSAERNVERLDPTLSVSNTLGRSTVSWASERTQRIDALYGELRAPILGGSRTLPLVQELTLTVALRYERYVGRGAPPFLCYDATGPLPDDALVDACPPASGTNPIGTTRNGSVNPTISARWVPVDGVAFRGSYATGYVPPRLEQLTKQRTAALPVDALDPLRGDEPLGSPGLDGIRTISGFIGGNPDLLPETSRSWTAGVVLEPAFARGLRLSADWTLIRKRNNYADVATLGFSDGDEARRRAFLAFLDLFPERFTRGPASDGFAVGPITSMDLSLANLAGSVTEAIDFTGDYSRDIGAGTLAIGARATYVSRLAVQTLPTEPEQDFAGVASTNFFSGQEPVGGLRWRGTGHIRWAHGDRWTIGWQTRFFSSYFIDETRTVYAAQGSAKVRRQIFHDLSGSYAFGNGFTLRAAISNVFNTPPARNVQIRSAPYSVFGDARGGIWSLTLSKAF